MNFGAAACFPKMLAVMFLKIVFPNIYALKFFKVTGNLLVAFIKLKLWECSSTVMVPVHTEGCSKDEMPWSLVYG